MPPYKRFGNFAFNSVILFWLARAKSDAEIGTINSRNGSPPQESGGPCPIAL